jgi:hypothetical protein
MAEDEPNGKNTKSFGTVPRSKLSGLTGQGQKDWKSYLESVERAADAKTACSEAKRKVKDLIKQHVFSLKNEDIDFILMPNRDIFVYKRIQNGTRRFRNKLEWT